MLKFDEQDRQKLRHLAGPDDESNESPNKNTGEIKESQRELNRLIQNVTAHYKSNSRIHEDLNKIEKCIIIDEILKFGNKDIEKM